MKQSQIYPLRPRPGHIATPALLDYFCQQLDHMSISSWQHNSAVLWATEFIETFSGHSLDTISSDDIQAFLARMKQYYRLSSAGYNEVMQSIYRLYRATGCDDPSWLAELTLANQHTQSYLPHLSRTTLRSALPQVEYHYQLPVALLYGSGLTPDECCNLRIGDVHLDRHRIIVRDAQGVENHQTVLPDTLTTALAVHLEQRQHLHMKDATLLFAGTPVPPALAHSEQPYSRCWRHQFFFCAYRLDYAQSNLLVRRALNTRCLINAINYVAHKLELEATFSAESLRNSFAHHLMQNGASEQLVQYVLGQLPELPENAQAGLITLESPLDELWPYGCGPWRDQPRVH